MNQLTPSNKFRIPTVGLITIIGILIALVAIFVFKVAVGLVLNYGLIAAMILSHFWMHAGHGNHGDHQEHASPSNPSDKLGPVLIENNDPQNHRHGCH